MKKLLLTLAAFSAMTCVFAQQFERKKLDYSKKEKKELPACDSTILQSLELALEQLEYLQSEQAVKLAEQPFKQHNECYRVYEVYGWALFRSGKWLEGLKVIEEGIDKFGLAPDLVRRRAFMGIEMAELGVSQRRIDGDGVFLPGREALKFEEASFKDENYKAALADFEYLATSYADRFQEIYITGYIHGKLGNPEKASEYFTKLLTVEEYKDQALLAIISNYMAAKQYDQAEAKLLELEKEYPRDAMIQKKLHEVYKEIGQKEKAETCAKKHDFFKWTPSFSDLAFTAENYELLAFFVANNPSKEKLKRLEKVVKKEEQAKAIDVCIAILKMHANHGNGLEDKATDLLAGFGKAAVPKTAKLLYSDVSTCTVTNAAHVLAVVKDTAGWKPLIGYLPMMLNMPSTLIPPDVPGEIMSFDPEKGAKVLVEFALQVIRLEQRAAPSDDPMAQVAGFGQNMVYYALKDVKKTKIEALAKEYGYTEAETNVLLEKIYGKDK